MPARVNDFITLIEITDQLLRQARITRGHLRRKPGIDKKFLQELTKMENILDVLKEHIKDIPDGIQSKPQII